MIAKKTHTTDDGGINVPNATLEKRVEALEKQVAQLIVNASPLRRTKDWRRTIGMFSGDAMMKRIFDEALKIREADRRRARRQWANKRRAKT